MTDEQAEKLVVNTDRIATALETFLNLSTQEQEIDIGKAVGDAMGAIGKQNPVFAAALREMENRMLSSGEKD